MTSTLPYLTSPPATHPSNSDHKKLRSACDSCHQCKVKCSGGSPCFRCTSKGLNCRYGCQNRAGKPKGSKNRKTLEREHQLRMEWLTSQLRDANGGLGNLNIDLSDPTTLLPSPFFQSTRWKQVSRCLCHPGYLLSLMLAGPYASPIFCAADAGQPMHQVDRT